MTSRIPARNAAWVAAAGLLVAGAVTGVLMSSPGAVPNSAGPRTPVSAPARPQNSQPDGAVSGVTSSGAATRGTSTGTSSGQTGSAPGVPVSNGKSRDKVVPITPPGEAASSPEQSETSGSVPGQAVDAANEGGAVSNGPLGASGVVCIDPGHPSETSDGANVGGLSENTLNWQVALRLRARLNALGIPSILTKQSENQMVTNRERADIANRAGAALLVRLHCDEGGGRGFTWYYPDRSGHKNGVTGPPRAVQVASRQVALAMNAAMAPLLKPYLQSNPVQTDAATFVGGKQGGVLTGSIFARVPTALIEMCFLNRRDDARFIASEDGQEKMAEALAEGIRRYLEARDGQTAP